MRLITALIRLAGPKLAVGAAAGAVLLVVTTYVERGRDLKTGSEVVPVPAKASPMPNAAPAERSRSQPLAIDRHALAVKSILPIKSPFRHGDFAWDESRAPAAGPVIITVDLKAQDRKSVV